VVAPGNDGNALMPEQVKRPNPWRKTMMNSSYMFRPNSRAIFRLIFEQVGCTIEKKELGYEKRKV